MKKSVFAISVLSLAIAGVHQAYAETTQSQSPQDCVVEGGHGESLKEWGMWCGVGSFLAALSELDPTAAGPGDGPEQDLNVNPPGRGDAGEYEPEVEGEESDPDLHIQLPGSGEFVGYFASQEDQYLGDSENEGYGLLVSNHRTGGISLSLSDGELDEGYGDSTTDFNFGQRINQSATYARNTNDGAPIDGESLNSDFDDGSASNHLYVDKREGEPDEQGEFHGGSHVRGVNEARHIDGAETVLITESGGNQVPGPGPVPLRVALPEFQILKEYWGGGFDFDINSDRDHSEDGMYLVGRLSPLDDIQSLISGDVNAVYTGNSYQWDQSVRLEVDFGDQTFVGQFGDIHMYRKHSAGIDINKDMSFEAEGVIDGVHLVSESVSTGEGFVQGSFFGEGGDLIGGAYDVTKDGDRVVDVFSAAEGEGNQFEPYLEQ